MQHNGASASVPFDLIRARIGAEFHPWRDAGVVERGGLENRCARERTEGSNPSLSANDLDVTISDHPTLSNWYMILMDYLPASDDAFYWAFLKAQPSILPGCNE